MAEAFAVPRLILQGRRLLPLHHVSRGPPPRGRPQPDSADFRRGRGGACLEAALLRQGAVPGPPLVIAGPEAVSWADLVRAVAHAIGCSVLILPLPVRLLRGMAWASHHLPGVPDIRDAEVRRLLEDKDFSTEAMRARLGVVPRPLSQGLAATFAEQTAREDPARWKRPRRPR